MRSITVAAGTVHLRASPPAALAAERSLSCRAARSDDGAGTLYVQRPASVTDIHVAVRASTL
jgi:hypothetical protein